MELLGRSPAEKGTSKRRVSAPDASACIARTGAREDGAEGVVDRRPEASIRTRSCYFSEIEKFTVAGCSGFTLTFLARVTGWL